VNLAFVVAPHTLTMSASAVSAVRLEGCSVAQGKHEDGNTSQAMHVTIDV
jgi:hypothetical protein